MAKVNLFIIGQPKSGTTALYDYLRYHPDLFLPDQKQLYYFALDHNQQRQKIKKFQKKYYRKYYNYSFDDYISHFNFNTKRKYYCDITPDYFYSNRAAFEIYKYNPDAKIILFLREPVEFLKSFHNQMINSDCENIRDFWEAYDAGKNTSRNIVDKLCPEIFFNYNKLIDYQNYLTSWVELFGKNLKVIIYEDFKNDNFLTLNSLYKFLGVNPQLPAQKIVSNVSVPPNNSIKEKIMNMYVFRYFSMLLPQNIKSKIKKLISPREKNMEVMNVIFININKEKEIQLRKELTEKIEKLDKYCKDNGLYLEGSQKNLFKKWGYD